MAEKRAKGKAKLTKTNADIKIQKGHKRKNEEECTISSSKESKLISESICKTEYKDCLDTTFGVDFPDDFYCFYEFYKENKELLQSALLINLTGPYDVLTGRLKKQTNLSKADYHLHGRFYYDTPELTTVFYATGGNGFHVAYLRDSPMELPQILICNRVKENGEFSVCGDNLFAATYLYCKHCAKKVKGSAKLKQLHNISTKIEIYAKTYGFTLDANSQKCKTRNKKVVTKTFHKAGLVVPVDKTGVGYRELPETDRDLKRILTKIVTAKDEAAKNHALDELQEIINLVQFANDECDYGMGLELGINLFTFGHEDLHGMILHLMPLAYQLLGKDLYAEIVEKHLKSRIKESFIDITEGND